MKTDKIIVALAGQPNCGKSTVFNALTGARQHVADYPGGHNGKNDRMIPVRGCPGDGGGPARSPMTKETETSMGTYTLRLAQEGEWVRIVSVTGKKGIHERLAGFGLRIGAEVQVLQNTMNGKLLIGHQGGRLYLGGGMAHKIQVAGIEGENR